MIHLIPFQQVFNISLFVTIMNLFRFVSVVIHTFESSHTKEIHLL